MEWKKNDEVELTVEDLGNDGEGIGHLDGYTLFVKGALPGEKVRVRLMKLNKRYGYARLQEILTLSPERQSPACPSAHACGGCTLQHLSYQKQLAYKEKKVKDCLIRIGGVDADTIEWLSILGMEDPWHYRNKAQFPVRMDERGNPVTGFFAGRSHRLIPVSSCQIQHPVINDTVTCVLDFMQAYHIPAYDEKRGDGLVRHVYVRRGGRTGQVMVCLVINGTSLPHSDELISRLRGLTGMTSICLNINKKQTNVILGTRTIPLWGPLYIEDLIGEIRFRIAPQSFYQVNPVQTRNLYETALSFADLKGNEKVWDLYCGIGTISLYFAKELQAKAKEQGWADQNMGEVFGVEIVPEAIANAIENARLNGIENVRFRCGAAEEIVPRLVQQEEMDVDVVVVDPPRKGCAATLLDTIAALSPERIVYVSCDPATLARDVKLLGERGYEVRKVRAVDMFGQGGHVETVCVLGNKNRKPDDYLKVNIDVDKIHDILDKEKAEKEAKEKSQSE